MSNSSGLAWGAAKGTIAALRRADDLLGAGKVIGLGISGHLPDPAIFAQQTGWAWFLASPELPSAPDEAEALRKLYNDPRVLAR